MKKITLIFTAILTMHFTRTFAQESISSPVHDKVQHNANANSGFYAGFRMTPQLSWMINKVDLDNSNYETLNRYGASWGFAGGYISNNHIGFELNVLYSMEGKRYKVSGTEYTQKMGYLKIPVLLTYSTCDCNFMLFGKLGPQVSVLNRAKVDPAIVNGTTISDNKNQFENVVIGGVASAGVRYAVTGRIWLDASLRYDVNFSNVEDNTYEHFPAGRADTYIMTAGIELGFNYRFR